MNLWGYQRLRPVLMRPRWPCWACLMLRNSSAQLWAHLSRWPVRAVTTPCVGKKPLQAPDRTEGFNVTEYEKAAETVSYPTNYSVLSFGVYQTMLTVISKDCIYTWSSICDAGFSSCASVESMYCSRLNTIGKVRIQWLLFLTRQ